MSTAGLTNGWVLDILNDHRDRMKKRATTLHVPALDGLMQHFPEKLLHVMPELFFQVEGVNRIDFPSGPHLLKPGQACLVPRGLPHGETFSNVRGRFRMMVLVFDGVHIVYHLCATNRENKSYPELGGSAKTASGIKVVGALDDMARLAQIKERWSIAALQDMWRGVLAWLCFAFNTLPLEPCHSPKIAQARFMIAQHLQNPRLGTALLADWIGCAPCYLSTLFRKEMGITLVRYIQRERMHKASYLLTHSFMSIKEIAYACGLGTAAYLTRLFHGFAGVSPRQYRAAQAHANIKREIG